MTCRAAVLLLAISFTLGGCSSAIEVSKPSESAVALAPAPAAADEQSYPYPFTSLEQLRDEASTVLIGRVQQSVAGSGVEANFTLATIAVDEVVAGRELQQIVVAQYGAAGLDQVDGYKHLRVGDTYLLFVAHYVNDAEESPSSRYVIVGPGAWVREVDESYTVWSLDPALTVADGLPLVVDKADLEALS